MKLKINRQHILFTEEEEVEKITYKEGFEEARKKFNTKYGIDDDGFYTHTPTEEQINETKNLKDKYETITKETEVFYYLVGGQTFNSKNYEEIEII